MEEVARFIRDISHRENWDRHLVVGLASQIRTHKLLQSVLISCKTTFQDNFPFFRTSQSCESCPAQISLASVEAKCSYLLCELLCCVHSSHAPQSKEVCDKSREGLAVL